MTPEQQFDRRMAAIHGFGATADSTQPLNVRTEEFEAMFDSFLGANYDPVKRKQVENLQIDLHKKDVDLYRRLQAGTLSPEKYVDDANAADVETAKKCETILGPADYEKLFGVKASEVTGLIDRDAFLGQFQANKDAAK